MNDPELNREDIELSIIIPIYNEQENIPTLIRRTFNACEALETNYEIILVDDGSTDSSREIINASSIKEYYKGKIVGVILSYNSGQHAAISAGMEVSKGKYIITMDADLQNPPEEIKKLLKKLRENYDVVGTIRDNRNDPFSRKVSSKLVNSLVRNFCKGHTMQDYGCMLRGYKRNIVNIILQCNERRRFIPMMAMSFARNPIEIHVNHSKRTAGESKYRFGDLISLLFDLLITTSVIPLRVLTFIGFLIAIFGFVFGLVIFILSQIDKQWGAEGTFALFAIMFVLTGGVFAALGLIGEYIGGIHLNTQQHPLYVIEEILDKKSN